MDKTFRTDQVGSLNRPPELLRARQAFRAGRLSPDELRAVEDLAIAEALSVQAEIGIDVLSDGEMRRDAWSTDLSDAVAGFAPDYPRVAKRYPDGSTRVVEMYTKAVEDRLRPRRHLLAEELPFLKRQATRRFKVTMPSPAFAALRCYVEGVSDRAYPQRSDFLADLVAIYRDEMRFLAREEVPYVQLDEGFATYVEDDWRSALTGTRSELDKLLEQDISAENECWDTLPESVVRAVHLCRGNRTRSGGTGSYDWVAERLFNSLHVDRFLLEYDTERAGGFAPLRFLPKGKVAVLGLVSSKYGKLESPDALCARIEEASHYCSLDQLALSAQCGFGGFDDTNHMSIDEQWRKFELIVNTAERVWGRRS